MTWLLTAKSGSSRGESWTIGPRPIVMGRSLSCDITIGDPTVSRKHCEVRLEGDGVVFRDLGSRNVSLVNGRAVEECRLLVGDELSLGTESFILTRTSLSGPPSPPESDPRGSTTVSLDEALYLNDGGESAPLEQHYPATVQDLARLHNFARKLGKAHREDEFAALCLQELEESFPARVKAALCCVNAGGLTWYPPGFAPSDDLCEQVEEAMTRGDACMSSHRAKRLFFKEVTISCVAPMLASGRSLGALVLQSLARDFIPEPDSLAQLNAIAQTASPYLGSLEFRGEIAPEPGQAPGSDTTRFLGESRAVEELRAEIERVARTGQNTLITGEAGTGKELAAHLIHASGNRSQGPIISANCMTLSGANFAAALTGSVKRDGEDPVVIHRGLLEQANGGTLVLRELDSLLPENQLTLLHLLERGAYPRNGGTQVVSFSVRVVGTSSKDLEQLARQGVFRRDLLNWIGRQRIHIKPLRRRPSDIRALAEFFVDSGMRQGVHQVKGLTEDALAYLQELPLHGNALELRNTITLAALQSRSELLGTDDLRDASTPRSERESVMEPLENAERTLISAVLAQCNGNLQVAAEILGLPATTLEKMTANMAGLRIGKR
ncbi:MAG: sigma 54-interacting transcriptional regulator [Candidatus Hydrogenedentes bacterium]|nr:sigma 54-interacting transcriptional regulator [Candidatus Hydrogenedentota bacterium]